MQLYQLGKLIGIGSFGQVFLCTHKGEGKHYVVKKLRIMDLEQKDRDNIENELKLLQKLRHPNIVSYKDSYTDKDGNLCIVMIYCEAGDMYSKIRTTKEKGKNFSESQILDWISQTALAIHYLHNKKILHRDLKSQNFFLKGDQKIRLGDFGIAKVLDNAQDLTTTCIGTPYYMAPEVFKYKPYSYKCDIWSFGVIIYEMCNLRLPFQATNYNALALKIMKGSYPSITPTFSKQLRDLITSMLSIKPQNRPTIIDIINKPFIRKRIEKYMSDTISRSGSGSGSATTIDNQDIFLDTLREQAKDLNIAFEEQENSGVLNKYPSTRQLERRWTRNILSRRGDEDDNGEYKKQIFQEKRRSLLDRDSLSLEKGLINKREDTTSSSYKALNLGYDLKDEKEAFIDHKKKSMIDRSVKTIEDKRTSGNIKNLHDRVIKNTTATLQHEKQKEKQKQKEKEKQKQKQKEKLKQQESNIRRFRLQEEYSMSDEQPEDDESENSINEEIIQEQSEEDLGELTQTRFSFDNEDEEVPQNYNKSYYKILDQIKVLKHICETGIGTSKYIRAYNAVNNGCGRSAVMEILGQQFIGYWHILDQIMFNDSILKTLSKQ